MESKFSRTRGAQGFVDFGSINRSTLKAKSAEVTGSPLWNFVPRLTLNVQVSPSGLMVQLSAASPTLFPLLSQLMRLSYIAPAHVAAVLLGSKDSRPKSVLAERIVPVGPPAGLVVVAVPPGPAQLKA